MLGKIFKREKSNAAIPEGKRVYAIGDIHGCAEMLTSLLDTIADDIDDLANATLVFLGDYIDRGPDSRAVVDRLLELKTSNVETYFLKGNHEASMLDFLDAPEDLAHWLDWGGDETLESYGIDPVAKTPDAIAAEFIEQMPAEHLRFYRALDLYHVEGDYLFVHAGVRPGVPLKEQDPMDLMWIRKRFHNAAASERPEHVVVHGHHPEDKPIDAGWRIAIDTGACYGGMLTAVALEGTTRRFLTIDAT